MRDYVKTRLVDKNITGLTRETVDFSPVVGSIVLAWEEAVESKNGGRAARLQKEIDFAEAGLCFAPSGIST